MIEPKQTYTHKKSTLRMQVLNPSPMHKDHWHVGLIQGEEIIFDCHVHHKDISEDWELEFRKTEVSHNQ